MEPAREPPWAEHEKRYLLAEILKSSLSSHALLNIIRDTGVQPRWSDCPLPLGRPLRSCQMVYDEMNATYPHSDYRQPRQLPAPPALPSDMSRKRPLPQERPLQPETTTTSIGARMIQPRPTSMYGGLYMGAPPILPAQMTAGEPVNKKKRGRPTKAESQARAQAAAARGESYPPPRKGRPPVYPTEPPPPAAEPPASIATPPVAPAPLPAQGTVTPQQPPVDQSSDTSSGKKRRGKPTPLELEKPSRERNEMQSPSAYSLGTGDQSRSQAYSSFTPISAPLPSADSRDRDARMEGVEDTQARTTTPHSFKDTVGI
ncbi:uncharacterized protein EI97DRAFT_260295 [Westerdykella ornata]|uniref:AT hook domain-containing protein n=1 Tax=Westerdykella ornata TaxID=318751 RepID=A0A6A6J556_WESOR|nr:uncharacterized protein EI97DRAFT_260295 [Westerdykella ornata]KAF2271720.1 hypothetical protein EI97DRAFT_260295 [Westerdykella ornata]